MELEIQEMGSHPLWPLLLSLRGRIEILILVYRSLPTRISSRPPFMNGQKECSTYGKQVSQSQSVSARNDSGIEPTKSHPAIMSLFCRVTVAGQVEWKAVPSTITIHYCGPPLQIMICLAREMTDRTQSRSSIQQHHTLDWYKSAKRNPINSGRDGTDWDPVTLFHTIPLLRSAMNHESAQTKPESAHLRTNDNNVQERRRSATKQWQLICRNTAWKLSTCATVERRRDDDQRYHCPQWHSNSFDWR